MRIGWSFRKTFWRQPRAFTICQQKNENSGWKFKWYSSFHRNVSEKDGNPHTYSRALPICQNKPVVPVGKEMERLTPTEFFRKKRDNHRRLYSFSIFQYRNDRNFLYHLFAPLEPGSDAMTLYVTSLGGDWPPHSFVPRLLRHLEMYSQMERLIPFAISSVGNAQYHLWKISHRKFRLNGKRPHFSRSNRNGRKITVPFVNSHSTRFTSASFPTFRHCRCSFHFD